ncbi:hypothetical protein QJS10_CPA10g01143 [Acorus calamus]|uniref:CAAX prenyl protease 2/Lysostaphin resistance protein A-like domain-containing protein n=1 Tax=Acorus calamus TaxID=4465 RepID=A0AAV9DYT4_ACOCL|nr:hypothetical protein QJS10_CPA10g01143 [Acorus calamus]
MGHVKLEGLELMVFGVRQFMLIIAASTVREELFYRVAVQGGLTDLFLKGTEFVKDGRGIAALEDLKKLFAAWYKRRQMKRIYSPLLEGLLALYLGFEWIRTGNILAPMITHGIYSVVILGHGLWKIHDHRRRLRHRIRQVRALYRVNKLNRQAFERNGTTNSCA